MLARISILASWMLSTIPYLTALAFLLPFSWRLRRPGKGPVPCPSGHRKPAAAPIQIGSGSATIRRTTRPNSRRVRWHSARKASTIVHVSPSTRLLRVAICKLVSDQFSIRLGKASRRHKFLG